MAANLYISEQIQILNGLEPVRKRPGMYIGSTGTKGLHHCFYEILDNAIDEHLAGFCSEITVTINEDNSLTVEDNGRGIPTDIHPTAKIPGSRVIFTVLHAGGKFDNKGYKVSGGLHGVGASVVNALSKYLKVEIYRDNNIYIDEFERGVPTKKLTQYVKGMGYKSSGKTNKQGTRVTFYPDDEIFETVEFKADIIRNKLKDSAYLNKGLKLILINKKTNTVETFQNNEGIVGLVNELNKEKTKLYEDVVYIEGSSDGIEVEIAFQHTNEASEKILSYCNNINTIEGGYHETGFKNAFTRTMNKYAKELNIIKNSQPLFDGQDLRNGILAIISIRHPNPQFEGQTKTKLGSTNSRGAVEDVFSTEIERVLDRNIDNIAKVILANAQKSQELRKAQEKLKKNYSKNALIEVNQKLAACQSRDPKKCEIFLVEGDSAGGSAKQGRDRKFQAILPLRGKILNVEKANYDKILKSDEIKSMITAFGCGIGKDFNIDNLRYDKIVIMTDADVDGAHIRTLLMTFLYRIMPDLIYNGKLYIAMPPLYKVVKQKKEYYFYSDKDLNKFIEKNGATGLVISRYKGLGEMNPEQLWQTTLNPETRVLKKVTIDDAATAEQVTELLMGTSVPPRRAFIEENAHYANVDI